MGSIDVEYFVNMTTHVPDGTPEDTVHTIRSHEAACAHELIANGYLLRLWRPPLAPGEWRTFGLFVAEDSRTLDRVLASMPLHVWRTDEVTPLSTHPNDPATNRGGDESEFLTTLTITVPNSTPATVVDRLLAGEAERARELAEHGRLLRLWTLPQDSPAQRRTLGLWSARDGADLTATLESLPLHVWMSVETTPLTAHPNDPMNGTRP